MPTREQLQQNIAAMEKQGAPQQDIQAYLDSFKQKAAPAAPAAPFNPGNVYQSSQQPRPAGMNAAQGIWNTLAGGASDLGTHIGQGAAVGTGNLIAALTGDTSVKNKVESRLQQPQTNIFNHPIQPLQPGMAGVKQIGGDLLKTGAEAAAFTAAPATIPAAIGTGAAVGAAQGAGDALQHQGSAQEVVKKGLTGGAIGGATGGLFGVIGKALGALGDKIQTSIIKPSKADIADGFSLDTIKKYNLGGSLTSVRDKTQAKLNDLSTQLSHKLQGANHSVDLDSVYKDTVAELTDGSKLKGFGANADITKTIDKLKNEVSIVGNSLSVPDAQVVKQSAGSFGAWQYNKTDPESKASEIVYNTFYNKLKTAIEKASPEGVRAINQELSKLIPIQNAIIRRLPVAQRGNAISLNDMIGLVGSSMNPTALGPTLLNLLSKSGTAANALSKVAPGITKAAAPASFATGSLAAPVADMLPNPGQSETVSSPQPSTEAQNTPEELSTIAREAIGNAEKVSGGVGGVTKAVSKIAAPFAAKEIAVATSFAKDHMLEAIQKAVSNQHILDLGLENKIKGFAKYLKNNNNPTLKDLQDGEAYLRQAGIKGYKTLGHLLEEATKQGRKANGQFNFTH